MKLLEVWGMIETNPIVHGTFDNLTELLCNTYGNAILMIKQ